MPELAAPPAPPPVGLMGEPMGNVATEQPGTALFPSTAFEGQDWFGLSSQLGRGLATSQAELGTVDDYGRQITPPEAPIAAADANKTYGIPGKLTFSAPLPASVAQSMHDAKQDEIAREDAASRTPPGFWPSAARMGAGFVAGALDPTNLAALFVPGLGEARTAGMLARAGVSGLGEDVLAGVAEGGAAAIPSLATRTAVRGITGAIGGAAAQAPLAALRYGLSQQEQGDYSALDALGDVMTMGAGLGALGHVGFGAIGDMLGQRFVRSGAGAAVADDPATAEAAMRTSVAQMVSGDPVEVQPVTMAAFVQRNNAAAVVMARTAALQREADALRAEADLVPGHAESAESPESMIRPPALDEATQGRMDAVLNELTDPANPPTPARHAELLAEHQMLSEGAAPGSELEQARSESQRSGLLIAAARIDDRIRELREGTPDDTASATFDRALSYAHGEPLPEEVATTRMVDTAARDARPDGAGGMPAALETQLADIHDALARADAAGLLGAPERAEMEAAGGWIDQAKNYAQGVLQAAACIARGMV
jgi:hypothetical protein